MQYRRLGKTGWRVSAISFAAWAIGGGWGEVSGDESLAALHRAVELGVNFFDTADVYGDGRSERLLAQLKQDHGDRIYVASKVGRRLDSHRAEGYNRKNLTAFNERSLRNLDAEALDLVQLHSPPTKVYYLPEVFAVLENLVQAGKVRHYGVSVEKVEEALKAIDYPGVATVQIIFDMFRRRPADLFFQQAQQRGAGKDARVPLASGMLTGKMTPQTEFAANDHRASDRAGEAFDKGETFAGVDYERGLKAVEELKAVCPEGMSMAQFALRWILMFDAVSCTIPGAKRPWQAAENAAAANLPPLTEAQMEAVRGVYDRYVRALVHHRW